jgi:hypothetical protein
MIPTELKIIVTSIILWTVAHFAAFPSTPFADWGEKMFGSYGNFIGALIFIFATPIIITGLYWLWSL